MTPALLHAAAMAVLDRVVGEYDPDVFNARCRAIAALPELAALYRASVELMAAQKALDAAEDFYRATFNAGGDEASVYDNRVSPARVRLNKAWIAFDAALAAVADALTKGEGK